MAAAIIFRLYVFGLLGCPQNKNGTRITVLLRPKELHHGILLATGGFAMRSG
jgi:hypothetical protein